MLINIIIAQLIDFQNIAYLIRTFKGCTEFSIGVALVKDNYIVIIRFTGVLKATFVTAYEVLNDNNLDKIIKSPDWLREHKYIGIEEEE